MESVTNAEGHKFEKWSKEIELKSTDLLVVLAIVRRGSLEKDPARLAVCNMLGPHEATQTKFYAAK